MQCRWRDGSQTKSGEENDLNERAGQTASCGPGVQKRSSTVGQVTEGHTHNKKTESSQKEVEQAGEDPSSPYL